MVCYFVGTLTVYVIVQFHTLQVQVFEFLSFMLLPCISLLQIILILTKYINDTSKELAESNDHETMMIELTKLYSSSELRIREYETVKERATNHKLTKPSYADLFTSKYVKRTIEGLAMLTLRGLCGFAVTRFFLSAIFKGMFAEILCISLIIAGALIAFFLINSSLFGEVIEFGKKRLLAIGSTVIALANVAIFTLTKFTAIFKYSEPNTANYIGLAIVSVSLLFYGLSTSPLTFVHLTGILPERGLALSMIWYITLRCAIYLPFVYLRYNDYLNICKHYEIYQAVIAGASIAVYLKLNIVRRIHMEGGKGR